jgi:hypothetical protein
MAKLKSTLIAAQEATATGISNGITNGDDLSGLVLYATTHYVITAGDATNDTIELADLPPGAVPIPQLSDVCASADPGTTYTLDVGDDGDADRYAAGLALGALATGGRLGFVPAAGAPPAGVGSPYRDNAKPTRVRAKLTTVSAPAAGVKLTFTIAYRAKA